MVTNVNTQPGIADEAGTNSLIDADSDDDREIIRIRTFHLDCSGVLVGDQIDEDVFCGKLTFLAALMFRSSS